MLLSAFGHIWQVRAIRNLLPFIAVVAAVVFANEASSALVRHSVEVRGAFWVLEPVVFVNHVENLEGTTLLSGSTGKSIYGLLVALFAGLSLWGLWHHRDVPFCWHRLGIGLLIGGTIADGYRLLIVGSVTDFIGLRPFGIFGVKSYSQVFSFADVVICLGAGVLGILVSQKLGKVHHS